MPKTSDVLKKCRRCGLDQPETWFTRYKYKGEVRRLGHCKDCAIGRHEKLPTETRVERWLKDQVTC